MNLNPSHCRKTCIPGFAVFPGSAVLIFWRRYLLGLLLPALLGILAPSTAEAACSPDLRKVFINEARSVNPQFTEIFIPSGSSLTPASIGTWKLKIFSSKNSNPFYQEQYNATVASTTTTAGNTCTIDGGTFIRFDTGANYQADRILELVDGSGDVVDVVRVGSTAVPTFYTPACTNTIIADVTVTNNTTNLVVGSGNSERKTIARVPDGGLLTVMPGSGATSISTVCGSNTNNGWFSLAKTVVSPAGGVSIPVGTNITMRLTLTENGFENAGTVTVTDVLDSAFDYVSLGTPSGGTASYSASTRTLTWSFTSFTKGATHALDFVVKPNTTAGSSISNTANGNAAVAGNAYAPSTYVSNTVVVPIGNSAVDHYAISYPLGSPGVTCEALAVRITAHDVAHAPVPPAAGTIITLGTSPSANGWALKSGAGSFISPNKYQFSGTENFVDLWLTQTTTATINIDVSDGSKVENNAEDLPAIFEGASLLFGTIGTQVSGVPSGDLLLRAVRSNPGNQCVSALNNAQTIKFGYECMDPVGCFVGSPPSSMALWKSGSTEPSPANLGPDSSGGVSYSDVVLDFGNTGEALFKLDYNDAGKLRLHAFKQVAAGSGSPPNPAYILSAQSGEFVVKPDSFRLTAVCADGTANGASQTSPGPGDPKFCRAGENFSIVATALNRQGNPTPSYGRESVSGPETVKVTWARHLPSPGSDGTLPSGYPAYTGAGGVFGTATNYAWSWSEVGTLKATTNVGDDNYLGAGNVASTSYVGRFYPNHFKVNVTPQCGGFVYSGRPGTTVIPVIPVIPGQPFTVQATAMNRKTPAEPTTNYTSAGGFAKAVDLTLSAGGGVGKLYVDTTQGGTGAIPAENFLSDGKGEVLYSAASRKISYVFDTFPFEATPITLHAEDSDTVTSTGIGDDTTQARSGRLRLSNAFGSEKSTLAMPIQAHYWSGQSWVLNSADSCTSVPAGAIALSGTLAPSTSAGAVTLAVGQGTLTLAKPAPVATGSMDVAINLGSTTADLSCLTLHPATAGAVLPWLRSLNGNCATTYDRDPSARATFGIYAPETRKSVHVREQF